MHRIVSFWQNRSHMCKIMPKLTMLSIGIISNEPQLKRKFCHTIIKTMWPHFNQITEINISTHFEFLSSYFWVLLHVPIIVISMLFQHVSRLKSKLKMNVFWLKSSTLSKVVSNSDLIIMPASIWSYVFQGAFRVPAISSDNILQHLCFMHVLRQDIPPMVVKAEKIDFCCFV